MDIEVDHIDVRIYGARNQLLGHTRVPGHLVPGFSALLAQAQAVAPAYTAGTLARWAFKVGYKAVVASVRRGKVEPGID